MLYGGVFRFKMYDMPTNVTRFSDLFTYANTVTGGFLGVIILIMCFCIAFFAMKNYDTGKAFASACFITTVIAVLLSAMALVSGLVLLICIIATALSVLFLFKS